MHKPTATELLGQLTPRVLAAASRHEDDRDLRAAVDILGVSPALVASDDPYAQAAAGLHEVADRIAGLAGRGLKRLEDFRCSLGVSMSESTVEVSKPAVDAIAAAMGVSAKTERFGSSSWHHAAEVKISGVRVWVYAYVPSPADPRDEELARLRAEVEQLRAGAPVPRSTEDGDPDATPVDHEGHAFPAGRTAGGAS